MGRIGTGLTLVMVILLSPANAQEKLQSLQLKYRVEKERIGKPAATLLAQYQARMQVLKDEFAEAGNLNGALTAKAAAKTEPTAGEVAEEPKEIAELQNLYLKQKVIRTKEAAKKLVALDKAYLAQLAKLRTSLVNSGASEQAQVVAAEEKKIAAQIPAPTKLDTFTDELCSVSIVSDRKLSAEKLAVDIARLSGGYRPVFKKVDEALEGAMFTRVPWGKNTENTVKALSSGFVYVFAQSKTPEVTGDVRKRKVESMVGGPWLDRSEMYRIIVRKGDEFSFSGPEAALIAKEIKIE